MKRSTGPSAMTRTSSMTTVLVALLTIAFVVAACDPGETEPLEPAEAGERLTELASQIDWVDDPIDRRASVEPGGCLLYTSDAADDSSVVYVSVGGVAL